MYAIGVTLPARWVMLTRRSRPSPGSRSRSPDFDVFEVARPYAMRLVADRYRPDRLAGRVRADLTRYAEAMLDYPFQVSELLDEFKDGDVEIRIKPEGFDQAVEKLVATANRVVLSVVAAALFLASAVIAVRPLRGRRRPLAACAARAHRRDRARGVALRGHLPLGALVSWRAPRVAFAQVAALADALAVPEPVAWALVRRGLADPAAAREFLAARRPLAPPEDLAGIAEAAERPGAGGAAPSRSRSTATTTATASRRPPSWYAPCEGGARVEAFLPSRFAEGYGVARVDRRAARGGRGAPAGLRRLRHLGRRAAGPRGRARHGDHRARPPPRRRPAPAGDHRQPALGRPAEDLPAAVGVVHMAVRALAARLDDGALAPDPDEGIDLVALATVADAVPLTGDNRRRVARGLRAIGSGRGRGSPRSARRPEWSRAP